MKPNVTVIQGTTQSGKKGIRFEHNLKTGDRVKVSGDRDGVIIGKGMAGMPEVEFPDKTTCLYNPSELELIPDDKTNPEP